MRRRTQEFAAIMRIAHGTHSGILMMLRSGYLNAFILICGLASASFADDHPPLVRFGADDTLGAVNLLSAEKVVAAASLVQIGKTYALGVETGPDTPAYPPRYYKLTITQSSDGTGSPLGSNQATANDDLMVSWMGIGSQLDGLGHLGSEHVYYNNLHASDFVTPTGLTKLSTHEIPPIVTRGVLLDMARHFGVERMQAGQAFNSAEIKAAAQAQGVRIEVGDVVLFNTGWQALADTDPDTFMSGLPGIGEDGAHYLAELGVVAVGADTWGLEVVPAEDPQKAFPVHVDLLKNHGVYILENMATAELAADEGWEFLFVLGQPRFVGTVQVVINPIAIR